ncbi:MAG TPA: His/Gly/Thr/Pro-type tRNA ligase C-terminal domain-containing protein, partial [Rubrivivax sp.]|nr:His/Gly/Thr/Pro-type tRNA ligase C-terminal domain-containing protein [Rubrivivax sp.]
LGIERVLDLLQQSGTAPPPPVPDAYAVVPDAAALPVAVQVSEALRAAGVAVLMHAAGAEGRGSMKAQFKRADASGARWALVFGGNEVGQGVVAVKPLRDAAAPQVTRPLADPAAWAAELLHR